MSPFEVYDMMTYKEKQIALWLTIERIANNDTAPVSLNVAVLDITALEITVL